jgi:DNA-binding NtrC family response regulator
VSPGRGVERRRVKVLVIAKETVIAALIGMLLELEEFEPVFARPDERPEDAIRRLQPPLIVVLDGRLDAAGSDLFFARASATGARVVLFSEPLAADDVRAVARQRRLPFFTMPIDRATLGGMLDRIAG